jgi:hypothetical protein
MTCFLCLLVAKKYSINIQNYTVRVSDKAVEIGGTSA